MANTYRELISTNGAITFFTLNHNLGNTPHFVSLVVHGSHDVFGSAGYGHFFPSATLWRTRSHVNMIVVSGVDMGIDVEVTFVNSMVR